MNNTNYEYYFDEIIKLAFQAKCEFAKDAREREKFKNKIIVLSNNKAQQPKASAVLPEQEDEMIKYKNKTIKKRADNRWWTRYYDKEGKQHSVYGKTRNECLNRLKEALRQNKNDNANITPSITLGEWIKKWLELYKVGKVKPSTLEQMQRYLKEIKAPLSNIPLKKLTSINLQEFLNGIDKLRKREKLFEFLKDALTKAKKNKLISEDLFDGVDKPKHNKKQSRALTHEEEARFVEACKMSNQGNLFLLCLYQGLRLGEALALTYDDIDFTAKTLTVNKSIDSLGNVTTPKTTTSIRTLPLFSNTAELFEQRNSGNIFTYPRKVYQNNMLRICKRLGFNGISIHSLRHTFATRCSERGVAVKVVQKWLGHSTIDMTLNVYTHVNADFEQKEIAKFDTYFDTYDD